MDPYQTYKTYSVMEPLGSHEEQRRERRQWRSKNRQWDYIIAVVCTGCGKTLSRTDNILRMAYCTACRAILFPETVSESDAKREEILRKRRRDML